MLIDIHGHPPRGHDQSQEDAYFAALARWDSRLLVSHLGPRGRGYLAEPSFEELSQGNDDCAAFVRSHPDILGGYCYVNPSRPEEALAEMEKRLLGQADAFVALKLWVAVRCSDPRLDRLMEFCAAHDVPVLQHTWMKVGPSGPGSGNLPGESTPLDLLALARRHPRVKFFGGHIGGDWEWGVAALKQADNVWLDVAGGEATTAYAEIALKAVGAGRIVYGTDVAGRSVPSQLAKIMCLDVPATDTDRMLWKNAAEVLGERLPAAWQRSGEVRPAVHPEPPAPSVRPEPVEGHGAHWSLSLRTRPDPVDARLIDTNAFLGDWPTRRIHGSPPRSQSELVTHRLGLMDRHNIARAVVSPLDAVLLKDVDVANRELSDLLADQPRLLPAYVLNPTWPTREEQLDRALSQYTRPAAIRLLPGYHSYKLDDETLSPFFTRLAERDVPVILTLQLEDSRMHHPAMRVPDVATDDVAGAIERFPRCRWLVANAIGAQIQAIAKRLPETAPVWFDVARVQGPIDALRTLAAAPGVGTRRLVFGTNLPLLVPESPIMELADARFSPDDAAAIARANAETLFGPAAA
jgi:hypothetical protein